MRQIGMAVQMYTQDYDEYLVSYAYPHAPARDPLYGWQVALMSYVKSSQLFVCPSAYKISSSTSINCDPTFVSTTGLGSGSYGYNYTYLGSYKRVGTVYSLAPISSAIITKPSETVIITEISALDGTGYIDPPTSWATTSASACQTVTPKLVGNNRGKWHGDGTNAIFTDGHCKWMNWSALGDYDSNGTIDNGFFIPDK